MIPNEVIPEKHPLTKRIEERFDSNKFSYYEPKLKNENLDELYGKHWFVVIDGNITKIILTEDFLESYYHDTERVGYNESAYLMLVQEIEKYLK